MSAGDDESERAYRLRQPIQGISASNLELVRQAVVSARKELAALMNDTERFLTEVTRVHNRSTEQIVELHRLRDEIRRLDHHLADLGVDVSLARYLDDK